MRFELVHDQRREPPSNRSARDARPPSWAGERFPRKRFPLVGPIIDTARVREVRGVCGECDTRLKVTARLPATIRCPVCGHSRELRP